MMHVSVQTEPAINLTALRQEVRQAVAIAKVSAFEDQAYRLGNIIAMDLLTRRIAADLLQDVAESNGLVEMHGQELIQSIIFDGLERK